MVRRTPLELSLRLSGLMRGDVLLKREDLQVGRSYKVRGAYNFISTLTDIERELGVVCASAGNHAQGVAFACRQLRIHGKVFLPADDTAPGKRRRIQDIGGSWIEMIIEGQTFDAASQAAQAYADESGAIYVHPFDDPRTIAGQGTVIKEVFKKHGFNHPKDRDCSNRWWRALCRDRDLGAGELPDTKIIGVEPSGAASMQAAIDEGGPVRLPNVDGFVDGTAVALVG